MSIEKEISFLPEQAADEQFILSALKEAVPNPSKTVASFRILRRSIDARHRQVKIILKIEVFFTGERVPPIFTPRYYPDVSAARRIVIVGAGPAGLFAALRCIESGMKPVILERGKDVQQRRRDLAAIHKDHLVNPESNYCFGEGGAGTYSDGKLYTRSTKRGDVRSVLETLVQFGASTDILVDAHPHIGTNKLPKIISAIREQILSSGGEIRFNTRMDDIELSGNSIKSIVIQSGEKISGEAYILATGHSARDVFRLFQRRGIRIEFKPFALGVRAEHPQQVIDQAQYHCELRPEILPPSSYNLVQQVDGRGVYSFCMCPGGIIAPCATEKDEVVTNGWSPSKRNNPWANSGIVVPVGWDDIKAFHPNEALAGMYFQKQVEQDCWIAAGRTQVVPAQRLIDFVENKKSADLPSCSYQPGLQSVNLKEVLPPFIHYHLKEGFKAFGKKMKGYYTNDAVLVAPESRTSSPVRIPRDATRLHHTDIFNLYPCAEGAGYAGGIVSAAIDGEKIATQIATILHGT